MTIQNLKELSKLIDLCRKKGIDSIEIDNIKLKLGHIETAPVYTADAPAIQPVPDYTPDDILNWSTHTFDGVG